MREYELVPNDGRKSYYKKAIVKEKDNGTRVLYSYGTPILSRDKNGNYRRLWGGWSATTGRHITAFCGMNKAAFMSLPYTLTPHETKQRDSGSALYNKGGIAIYPKACKRKIVGTVE